ncbi:MAG TPA: hypothetical protein VHZ76_01090 [Gammaproteobacteria bacterium]|nr:hypothetical protein [Gammaproteobacteria bacterium]
MHIENTLSLACSRESEDKFISLLPSYSQSETLLIGDKLPCHDGKIKSSPIEYILDKLKRKVWAEGLYARKDDLHKIKRYQNIDKSYKNDFNETKFLNWVKTIEENTAICDMENRNLGNGIFVPPGKKLSKGTFIPSSGIIKLNPTKKELETKIHCSALQDLDSDDRKIIGLIDPAKIGGILDLINHAPDEEDLANFKFKEPSLKKHVATANLRSTIKFYNGYAIMGLIVFEDIQGDKAGKQLLWSYAHACEYIDSHDKKVLMLFDKRNRHNGEILDVRNYSLSQINIFIDTGELMFRKVASLSRWELMESPPGSNLIISTEDPYSSSQSEAIKSPITYGFLQTYLKRNPRADRIILRVHIN